MIPINKLRTEAEKLREQGYSYNLIHEKLGISKSTMSNWFKDKPFLPNEEVQKRINNSQANVGIMRHNNRVQETQILKEQGANEVGNITKRDLWMLGLGLSNSDPAVIQLSIKWFKEVLGLTNENFSVRLHLYPDNKLDMCQHYWQDVTGLSKNNFRRPSIDRRIDKKTSRSGKLPYGTAHITIVSGGDSGKGVRLFRRMNGWIVGVMNQVSFR
jgi:transcriptional regulator with XRE-family HTH domain